jgi:hypothetical protein
MSGEKHIEFYYKIFFSKNQKSVSVVARGIEFQVQTPWQNFRKLSQFSINGRIWLTFRLRYVVQYENIYGPAAHFIYLYILYCKLGWYGTGASGPPGGRARDFVNFRRKNHASRARSATARVWQFTLPGSRSGMLRLVVLSHAIENQNSDFVTV